ncbi:cilia- and flagella-associated protein 144 [Pelodytes ibericus]
MAAGGQKAARDEVSLNAIHRETIRKENRCQRLVTEFGINPYRKVHAVAGKPMSRHDNQTETADDNFLKIIHHSALEPTKKYTEPQTTSQEIGWISKPLIDINHSDRRLHHYRQNSEITTYMETAWRLKEQSVNLQ